MSVEINDDQDVPLDLSRLESKLLAALHRAGHSDSELSVLLTDDARICELNRTYRGIDTPTDVLSFPQDVPSDPEFSGLLGDIVISIPTAAGQAEKAGITLADEIDHLALHGLLHLLGHDHETEGWESWNRALAELSDHG